MKWIRGKKGRRDALSTKTGATYVYADGTLRVARTKGAWESLGTFPDLDAAQRAAQDHDQLLDVQGVKEALIQTEGLVLAREREQLRNLYRDVVTQGPCQGIYRAYCNLRRQGITPGELVAHMGSLDPVDRAYLGRAFEDFYRAGMRLT